MHWAETTLSTETQTLYSLSQKLPTSWAASIKITQLQALYPKGQVGHKHHHIIAISSSTSVFLSRNRSFLYNFLLCNSSHSPPRHWVPRGSFRPCRFCSSLKRKQQLSSELEVHKCHTYAWPSYLNTWISEGYALPQSTSSWSTWIMMGNVLTWLTTSWLH